MNSNLECIGIDGDGAGVVGLVSDALARFTALGTHAGVRLMRWQGPSGARLTIGTRGHDLVDLTPSFAGRPGVRVASCRALNDGVVAADIVDEAGEQLSAMAFELEQRRAFDETDGSYSGPASITAMGVDVRVYASAQQFRRSPGSRLDWAGAPGEDPAGDEARRMAPGSFISFGVFDRTDDASAYARLNGVVLESERHRNELTGNDFIACRVQFLGDCELTVLLDGRTHPHTPVRDAVVAGIVYLVASFDDLSS